MSKITTTLTVAVAGGKTTSVSSRVIDAEAITEINVAVPADGSTVTVDTQPSSPDKIRVLLLSSTFYGTDLTYVFSDGTTDSTDTLTLDSPQLFSSGNLASISVDPNQIKFTMAGTGEDATVSILVAREAVV